MPNTLHTHTYQIFRGMLIAARERSGLTQVQIAEYLNKPQSFISKYERGERRLDFTEFMELVNILNIDVLSFVDDYRSAVGQAKPLKIHKAKRPNSR